MKRRRDRRRPGRRPHLAALVVLVGCATLPPSTEWEDPLPLPSPDSVDAVVFLVGDAGEVAPGRSPVMAKLQEEVEGWSRRLARDSAAAVFFLGDNVYPAGVHDRRDPVFRRDSLALRAQVEVVGGPEARRFRTPAYFLAGNHDWGQMAGRAGLQRLRNEEALLGGFRDTGARVELIPDAGDPGPSVVDVGRTARYLAIDTHWWLQAQPSPWQDTALAELSRAIRDAGRRQVAIATHHPFVSGGSHGGPMPIWRGFGILWILRKTGSLVQDINSVPYRSLLSGLRSVFGAEGPPLLFAGGHDHSLQVLQGGAEDEPRWSVVSGAGSKLTDVGPAPGMLWGRGRPGFMRVTYMRNGSVYLHVYITGGEYQSCGGEGDARPVATCMEEGLDEFHLAFATTLSEPGGVPVTRSGPPPGSGGARPSQTSRSHPVRTPTTSRLPAGPARPGGPSNHGPR